MLIRVPQGWEIPEREVTPQEVYLRRREFLRAAGVAGLGSIAAAYGYSAWAQAPPGKPPLPPGAKLAPGGPPPPKPGWKLEAARNPKYTVERPITSEQVVAGYNNFYEFSEDKEQVKVEAQNFKARPWQIEIAGLVARPRTIDVDDLIKQMPLEERVYRLRCVEAWSVVVPWIGFPLKKFVEWAQPKPQARYLRMVSFLRPAEARGQREHTWYPWPYFEALTLAEATSELALLVVGMYGHILWNQNGAPIRLITPWKYGFKSIKSVVKFEFTKDQPKNFWNVLAPDEYDFYANVNPKVPHPRWSQATERLVETGERIPTQPYNGYGAYVAHLYR